MQDSLYRQTHAITLIATVIIFGRSSATVAMGNEMELSSLRGIAGFYVRIGELPYELRKMNLQEALLRRHVENRISGFGITLIDSELREAQQNWEIYKELYLNDHELEKSKRVFPYLNVVVQIVPGALEDIRWKYHIELRFYQRCRIIESDNYSQAVTWRRSTFVIMTAEDVRKTINRAVNDLVDEFISDYLQANPSDRKVKFRSIADTIQKLDEEFERPPEE